MHVKMKELYAGPLGVFPKGLVHEVTDELGGKLIEAKDAELCDPPADWVDVKAKEAEAAKALADKAASESLAADKVAADKAKEAAAAKNAEVIKNAAKGVLDAPVASKPGDSTGI